MKIVSFDRGNQKVRCAICGLLRQEDECAGMAGHYRCILCLEESRLVGPAVVDSLALEAIYEALAR